MGCSVATDVNELLKQAGKLRRAATATSMTVYREKMLKVARDLEAHAAMIEESLARETKTGSD